MSTEQSSERFDGAVVEFGYGSLADLVSVWVERSPEAIAVMYEGERLSYMELDARAERLSRRLRARGVGPEVLVGVCAERSLELVVGLLGVLKAGGAYVPLDPGYPRERLEYMVGDSGVGLVLTQAGLLERVGEWVGVEALVLEEDGEEVLPEVFPGVGVAGENLAYMIYTSGSTGRPKGAMNTHRGIVNRLLWMQSAYGLEAGERVLQKTPFSFDVSVWEFFWPLVSGATIVLAKPEGHRDAEYLVDLIASRSVTTVHFVPSMLEIFLRTAEAGRCGSLRRVICSGEALPLPLLRRFRASFSCPLYNLYGPTEAAVDVTHYECVERADGLVPIGRPVSNTRVHVLDGDQSPVPVGVSGELYLGGVQVGRGYWGRPELTAERFVPDPFGAPGARLYRTGDSARLLPDGNVAYGGRLDSQVKLRGFRIELGEIESALVEHGGVRAAAAAVRETEGGDRQLVAYVVPRRRGVSGAGARTLANGLTVLQQNRGETDFLYREIFESEVYSRHGIVIEPEACVFDVGANIGLFALYAGQRCPGGRIYCFEPLPPIAETLRANVVQCEARVKVLGVGLGEAEGEAEFVYYRGNSIMSGRKSAADRRQDLEMVRQFMGNREEDSEETLELVRERMSGESFRCPLRRLSEVMRAEGVEHIDLLKIDVERAEWQVLGGIDEEDWARIDQVVLEVHDEVEALGSGQTEKLVALLRQRGFTVSWEEDEAMRGVGLYNVYATRYSRERQQQAQARWLERAATAAAAVLTPASLRSHLQQKLPEYMVPAFFVLLDELPLSPNGKINRNALPDPKTDRDTLNTPYAAPEGRNQEILCALFAEILGIATVGAHDKFFELGGHSLLAIRLLARVRAELGVSLPLRSIFDAPTPALLDPLVQQQRNIPERKLAKIERARRNGLMPLSLGQESLWFLDRLRPGGCAYNIPCGLWLEGPIDTLRLHDSIVALVRRHETLRTRFNEIDGVPAQIISESLQIDVPVIDLSDVVEGDRELHARRLLNQEAHRPFDLQNGPLFRSLLIRLETNRHVLLMVIHHAVCDGESVNILWSELAALYNGEILPDLPIQYADFAIWQRDRLQLREYEEELGYWRQALLGMPRCLEWRADRLRGGLDEGGGHVELLLEGDLLESIRRLSVEEGASVFMTLLAAYQALLGRYTGQQDFGVGVPVANRAAMEVSGMTGFFVNMIVLRAELWGDPTFRQFLLRVRERALAGYAHQDLPFERLVEELQPERVLGQTPLFQMVFDFQPGVAPDRFGDASAWPEELVTQTSKFDLVLAVRERAGALLVRAEYSTALFDAVTIERFLGHYRQLLSEAVSSPESKLWELESLTDKERTEQDILQGDDSGDEFGYGSLADLVSVWVERSPEAIAVMYEGERLSYMELDARAERLSRRLRARGVGPEVLVGVCAERSLELVVGLLGVLKAGGAYVPLDPGYPRERLEYMVGDSGVGLVLTQAGLLERVGEWVGVEALVLEEDGEEVLPEVFPGVGVAGENLAYMIYTSGSTGRPKGAMNTHRGIVNRLLWMQSAYGLEAGERVLQKTPFSFDVSVWEFFWPLVSGATIVLAKPEGHRDAEYLVDLIASRSVTTVHFVPSMLEIFLRTAEAGRCGSLRRVICSGEALPLPLLRRFRASFSCPLYNLYGPTEAAVDVTHYECVERADGLVPIGRPVSNTRVHVLDGDQSPVPVGVSGELYLGGVQVGRGYWGRPELTAERFVPDPFGAPGARLYRTGDSARLLPDGNVAYGGRLDSQVKLRGFRIELGEIESALVEHGGVRAAAAAVRETEGGDRQLVAYVVPRRRGVSGAGARTLANGLTVLQQNRGETDFLYREIFESEVYSRHGIVIEPEACVFDVGANIGLFALYAGQRCPGGRIYCFEPLPPIAETLRANVVQCEARVKVLGVGLGEAEGEAEFVYYRGNSIMSGRKSAADRRQDLEMVRQFMGNREEDSEETLELVRERMSGESFRCPLRRLSEVMRAEGVEHIDLLKIDVERAEWQVLGGIDEEDWARIDQVVLEVHDEVEALGSGQTEKLVALLRQRGFTVSWEEDEAMRGVGLYNVYATRYSRERQQQAQARWLERAATAAAAVLTPASLRSHLQQKLPEYMVPAFFVLLDELPLSPNGKINRNALPDPKTDRDTLNTPYAAPEGRNQEILCALFAEILGIATVGAHDKFFELGGHSLLAIRLLARVRAELGVSLPLRSIFDAPTPALLDPLVQQQRNIPENSNGTIEVIARSAKMPVSYEEEFFYQLNDPSFSMASILRLTGDLDRGRLQRSLDEMALHHEVLRSRFKMDGDRLYRFIGEFAPVECKYEDLSNLSETQTRESSQLLAESSKTPFDLATGPLFRATLLKLEERRHLLQLEAHHIVVDAWSMDILCHDFMAVYEALSHDKVDLLPAARIQYADYASWQKSYVQQDKLLPSLDYWKRLLNDSPSLLQLPTDYPRPAVQGTAGKKVAFDLPKDDVTVLRDIGRQQGATLFMVLLSAFKLLLFRQTAETRITIGTPIVNRDTAELEQMVGLFVNSTAISTDLSGNPTFSQLLEKTKQATLNALAHRNLPMSVLVRELQVRSDRSHTAVSSILFNTVPGTPEQFTPPKLTSLSVEEHLSDDDGIYISSFDLLMTLDDRLPNGNIQLVVSYDTALFSSARIQEFVEQFKSLITQIARSPEKRIEDYLLYLPSILSATPNDRPTPYLNVQQYAHAYVDKWANADLERVAISEGTSAHSYRSLQLKSNQLANCLLQHGITRGHVVLICGGRTAATVVAMLGVMRSGAAFALVEPDSMEAEVYGILGTGVCNGLISTEAERLPRPLSQWISGTECRLFMALDGTASSGLEAYPATNPEATISGNDAAYITRPFVQLAGEFAVVPATHQRLANCLEWLVSEFDIRPEDHIGQLSQAESPSFVEEIFIAFAAGAQCHIPSPDDARADSLGLWIEERKISTVILTPMLWRRLEVPAGTSLDHLRLILWSQGSLFNEDLRRARKIARTATSAYLYGVPEAPHFYGCYRIPEDGTEFNNAAPIGKGMPGAEFVILNESGNLAGVGELGRICLVMPASDIAQTRHPLLEGRLSQYYGSGESGSSILKTDELGRLSPERNIEIVGNRYSSGVVAGYTVQFTQVESVLLEHARVAQAAVTTAGETEKTLVAYIVFAKNRSRSDAGLQTFLSWRLPAYKVPVSFIAVDSLPITRTGDLDRASLMESAGRPFDESQRVSFNIGEHPHPSEEIPGVPLRAHTDLENKPAVQTLGDTERRAAFDPAQPFRSTGVYLITGGAGALGLLFAKEIASRAAEATIVLAGRSPLSEEILERLRSIRETGPEVVYQSTDVSDRVAVGALIGGIRSRYQHLDGIIHAAGAIQDGLATGATQESLSAVLSPKIAGAINIDQATKHLDLDFVVLFSSVAGVLGNIGQLGYAAANAFLDRFAEYRRQLSSIGERRGRTLSIAWPLWEAGGMRVDSLYLDRMRDQGLCPLSSVAGIEAFYRALASDDSNLVVFATANTEHASLPAIDIADEAPASQPTLLPSMPEHVVELDEGAFFQQALRYLRMGLSSSLKLSTERFETDVSFEKYGIDSILVMQLTTQLEKSFGTLPKTLFFEYQNLTELTYYFVEEHRDTLARLLTPSRPSSARSADVPIPVDPLSADPATVESRLPGPAATIAPRSDRQDHQDQRESERPWRDIAIIGLAGRYPKARNLREFWENLRAGVDCITEIPADRWEPHRYYDAERGKQGSTYSKWGGFIDGVDEFDPLFFNISPREAQGMDPQERLFLQCVHETLEDAGYTRKALSRLSEERRGGSVGVFVGVMYEEYQLFGAQAQALDTPFALFGNPSTIANRVSYFFDLHGPSMAVDTMCSSSLTAIHLACHNLQRGVCEMAIAGGVNVSIHPNKYLVLSQGQFLSSSGHCESFGQGGDGYVPGEGVGAVLLKPLAKAIADGDQIYGVIKGSAINHGGKTNGYSVPNLNAQSAVVSQALTEAGISPRAISYIEAHGTGTSLGDPIEIAGLTKAFARETRDRGFCSIGSVKSNVGHCESAAGIAGLTKVLLQMKHGELVPSLHSEALNPHIDFETTPFLVQRGLSEWKRPVLDIDGAARQYPRIAGLSSFGAGGSNAHLIIEEYLGPPQNIEPLATVEDRPEMVVLSARNKERLLEYALELKASIEADRLSDQDLPSIAYTLQVGREAMEFRLALIVYSIAELQEKLGRFVAGNSEVEGLYFAEAKSGGEPVSLLSGDEDMAAMMESWLAKGKYSKVLELWSVGIPVRWESLNSKSRLRRLSLPTYPFSRERYFVPKIDLQQFKEAGGWINNRQLTGAIRSAILHPLLHENSSTLSQQRFTSTFTGKEFFFADHIVHSERMLPGVAYLEMARVAFELANDFEEHDPTSRVVISNVVWARPVVQLDSPVKLHIGLYAEEAGEVSYEIYSERDHEEAPLEGEDGVVLHSQGTAQRLRISEHKTIDLSALLLRCDSEVLTHDRIYELHEQMGILYGPAHRGLESIRKGTDDLGRFVLARVVLPTVVSDDHGAYVLHPSLMDSALQASLGLLLDGPNTAESSTTWVPFALESCTILSTPPASFWVMIREASTSSTSLRKLDYDLLDDQGRSCVQVRGFTARAIDLDLHAGAESVTNDLDTTEVMTFIEDWEEQPLVGHQGTLPTRAVCFRSDLLQDDMLTKAIPSLNQHIDVTFVSAQQAVESQDAWSEIERQAADMLLYAYVVREDNAKLGLEGIAQWIRALAAAKMKCQRVVLIVAYNSALGRCYVDALLGFARSLRSVLRDTTFSVLGMDEGSTRSAAEWGECLRAELSNPVPENVIYAGTKRLACKLQEIGRTHARSILRADATYMITGGAGGLGMMLARHLAARYSANIILSGRSPLDDQKNKALHSLEKLGSKVFYMQADVCNREQMEAGLREARSRFGPIHGVIHLAGIESPHTIVEKDMSEFRRVLAPKIDGTLLLEECIGAENALDFVCYFSSSSAILGDFGNCDYAIGNRFQTAYARYRNASSEGTARSRKTLAINWPLWNEGGMGMQADSPLRFLLKSTGQRALELGEGFDLLERLLAEPGGQRLVMAGERSKINRTLGLEKLPDEAAGETRRTDSTKKQTPNEITEKKNALLPLGGDREPAPEALNARTVLFIKKLLSTTLAVPIDRIDANAPLERYGIDSIMVMELTNDLEREFGSLSKTLLFEYQTIHALASYFVKEHRAVLTKLFDLDITPSTVRPQEQPVVASKPSTPPPARRSRFAKTPQQVPAVSKTQGWEDIAIIGISGRYPQANDLSEYWENLKSGKDCVTEVPKDRWDHSRYFDPEKGKPGKSYSKWGGFLADVDKFDPIFFNISPLEAEYMDPQERLFLQCAYEAMEDAGYTREALSKYKSAGIEGNVGVFVGVMYVEYTYFGAQAQLMGVPLTLFGHPCSLANRVSYYCNFHGPSMAVDTMCSSSLTSIHLACQSLQRGECEVAIAGGVNVSIHPNKYLVLAQARFVSSVGRCESFGEGGDGYVPGEGVGAMLLKPLAKAIADEDQILGVIKGTAVNHGGKTNGFSVPNPNAQANVIARALRTSGILPQAISYIEAHGTGTKLGDPIEIAGLSKAFSEYTQETGFCAIGSAKSNIGHCESAAGVAGVTKVLLQMKHGLIAPSLHSKTLNPHINFNQSPFVVQQELGPWVRPRVTIDGETREYPRIAGVSSFGASGANAHVILQEYVPGPAKAAVRLPSNGPRIVLLSARSEAQLRSLGVKLLDAIEVRSFSDSDLPDLAYTLQIGREAMEYRLALLADSIRQLKEKLRRFLANEQGIEDLYRGDVFRNKEAMSIFAGDDDTSRLFNSWFASAKYGKLMEMWVKGVALDWSKLYGEATPKRISLPTYPFARDTYFISKIGISAQAAQTLSRPGMLHPLAQVNTSNISGLRFSSTFTGDEFFLSDHIVRGSKVLPGVAYLEMARAAIELSGAGDGNLPFALSNVVWSNPFRFEDGNQELHITLDVNEFGAVAYEIYSEPSSADAPLNPTESDQRLVHSQGIGEILERSGGGLLDLQAMRSQCNDRHFDGDEIYDIHKRLGMDYGIACRAVESIHLGRDAQGRSFALARIEVPTAAIDSDTYDYVLHPSLLDSALHASLGLVIDGVSASALEASGTWLPFALDQILIYNRCPDKLWAWIREAEESSPNLRRLHYDLCDDSGRVCVEIRGFTSRLLTDKAEKAALAEFRSVDSAPLLTFSERWIQSTLPVEIVRDPNTILGILPRGWSTDAFEQEWHKSSPLANIQLAQPEGPDDYQATLLQVEQKHGALEALLYARSAVHQPMESAYKDISVLLKAINALRHKPQHVMLAGEFVDEVDRCYVDSWLGLARSLKLVFPDTRFSVVGLNKQEKLEVQAQRLWAELQRNQSDLVFHEDNIRQISVVEEIQRRVSSPILHQGGAYLITGGAGGIGYLLAQRLAGRHKAHVILTGRSAMDDQKQELLSGLETQGATAVYLQADVCNRERMEEVFAFADKRFGSINGLFHVAGVESHQTVLDSSYEEIEQVLASKTRGTLLLDELCAGRALDFVCYFSSLSAVLGDFGSCAYSAGARFQTAYASRRMQRPSITKTIAVGWPLWRSGGMAIGDERATHAYLEATGQRILESEEALDQLEQMLGESHAHQFVLAGSPRRIAKLMAVRDDAEIRKTLAPIEVRPSLTAYPAPIVQNRAVNSGQQLEGKAVHYLKTLLATSLKFPVDVIEADAPLENYGIESVLVMKMTGKLEEVFGSLSKTLLFEHQSIRALAKYFLTDHADRLGSLLGVDQAPIVEPIAMSLPKRNSIPYRTKKWGQSAHSIAPSRAPAEATKDTGGDRIAIIGLSGRYPQAENVAEFWENLKAGKDCITEIPEERWDYKPHYDAEKGKLGKTYCKWGGFVDGADEFDPMFFNISPRDAEGMDPQERLFLQCACETIQDAGYTRDFLARYRASGIEGNVGVFVGVMYEEYQLFGAQAQTLGMPFCLPGSAASIANRVSYFCNFHGPSIAVDTMCSSSLTAIHLACQSLLYGGCEVAIAGGVNLSLHPNKYLGLAQGQFVSSHGRCESFGEGGDGYVPGEGVGAVLLKPLAQAVEDGDHIYGVIRATAINHGGKTNGFSVPNPGAQANVVAQTLIKSGIPPRAISYVEAHGTGTTLGDPIEIAGLSKAFAEFTSDRGFCALGSAKSNIGHCESAAGIAGLTKVLLQMKHGKIAPSLHSDVLNPHIDFGETPFVVQHDLAEWKRPVLQMNGSSREFPRIAGLSSFGAGGSNAHIVVEEYRPHAMSPLPALQGTAVMILLSAKNEDRLRQQAERLLEAVRAESFRDVDLIDIAYTLQVGREAMEHRLAFTATAMDDLQRKLEGYLGDDRGIDDFYQGDIKRGKDVLANLGDGSALQELLEQWLLRGEYGKALRLWVNGLTFDWLKLYEGFAPNRISLPTYPFARERYWIPAVLESWRAAQQHKGDPSLEPNDDGLHFNAEFFEALLEDVTSGLISVSEAAAQTRTGPSTDRSSSRMNGHGKNNGHVLAG